MAGRSFFRRLLGNRSDAVGPDDVSAAPSPAGPIPIPHPFDDGPTPVKESISRDDLPGDTSPSDVGERQAVADAEPTAFDEADAVFGTRTGVSPNNVVADPDDGATALTSDDGIVGMNGIISPNNVVVDTDGTAGQGLSSPSNVVDPTDGVVVRDPDGNVVAMEKEQLIDAAPDNADLSKGDVPNSDRDEEIVGMNGIISPNNVVDDPDDDLLLADLSGGSIGDQLAANAGVSFDAPASDLTDDLDGLDDVDLD